MVTTGKCVSVIRGQALVSCDGETGIAFGVQLGVEGLDVLKVNGTACGSVVEFVRFFPAVFFCPSSVDELLTASAERRAFLNFSLFHVEQNFQRTRLATEKARSQLNSIAKNASNTKKFFEANGEFWLDEFGRLSSLIDRMRRGLIEQLKDTFRFFLNLFELHMPIVLSYSTSVLDREDSFYREMLPERRSYSLERLVKKGHVDFGYHRSDLKILCEGRDIAEVLSRGQQRLVILALKLSQLLNIEANSLFKPMFLLDDLGAELDDKNQQRVLYILEQCGVQSFVSSITRPSNSDSLREKKLFHVEHGVIVEES